MQQLWKMFNKNNWKLKTACLLCWWEFALLLGKLLMHSILVHIWWCLPTKQYAIATFIVKLVDKPLLHHLCSGTCMLVLIIAIHSNHTICACMLILLIKANQRINAVVVIYSLLFNYSSSLFDPQSLRNIESHRMTCHCTTLLHCID